MTLKTDRLVLRVEGVGKERHESIVNLFTLVAAAAMPGTLWVSDKKLGKRTPWAVEYVGNYSEHYYQLLCQGTNDWTVSLYSPLSKEDS